jgi:hypothetical protein
MSGHTYWDIGCGDSIVGIAQDGGKYQYWYLLSGEVGNYLVRSLASMQESGK